MAVMTRWDAFHDLRAVQDEMNYLNRMFAQTGGRELQRPGFDVAGTPAWAPEIGRAHV